MSTDAAPASAGVASAATAAIAANAAAVAAPAVPAVAAPTFTPAFSIGELQRGGAQLLSLAADLESMNACVFCLLRFANVRQVKAYEQSLEWLQSYTSIKLGWPQRWATSGCPLCIDVLCGARGYFDRQVQPALLDEQGQWRYELDQFSLNISEPILAKIRQYAANQVFKKKYRSDADFRMQQRAAAVNCQSSCLIGTCSPCAQST